jgi:hypothetical protein
MSTLLKNPKPNLLLAHFDNSKILASLAGIGSSEKYDTSYKSQAVNICYQRLKNRAQILIDNELNYCL